MVFCFQTISTVKILLTEDKLTKSGKYMYYTTLILGQLHDDDIWLQLPEFNPLLLCYLNLSIPLRIKEQSQENNKLKDSGSCSKITSSYNYPILLRV